MKQLKLMRIFSATVMMMVLSGSMAHALYHHVDGCSVCHYAGGVESAACTASSNNAMIKSEINTPNSGLKYTVFGPYIVGNPAYNGVCEVCHTLTDYHRNNASGDHDHYKELGCILCHAHKNEFAGGEPEDESHVIHTSATVRGPSPLGCVDCHSGGYDIDQIVASGVCDPCHSQGGAYDGIAMAKAGWGNAVYEGDGQSLKSGNETWCVGCHDSEGATIGGRTADDVAGDDAVYGYYASGHGLYNVGCTDCHDPQYTHIDTYDRTYDAEAAMDGPRGYQQGFRLKSVNGIRPLYMPRLYTLPDDPLPPEYTSDWMDPNHFALCYECHKETKIQGTYLNKFCDIESGNGPRNLHWSDPDTKWPDAVGSHLGMASKYWKSDRDGHYWDSAFSCPTCHDPHSRLPFVKAAGVEFANTRANFSMTRQDMSLVNVREVERSYAHMSSPEWADWGGDLACQDACHIISFGLVDTYDKSSFRLGTRPPAEPAFWTQLNGAPDITSPTFGSGGTLLGSPTFEEYTDVFGDTQTGIRVDALDEGAQFSSGNLNIDDELYGETIDFWYAPDFDVTGHTGEEYLFHCYYDDNNWIVIQVIEDSLLFQIRSNGADHNLRTSGFPVWDSWMEGTARNIVCTWGPAHGMHVYVDKKERGYSQSSGLDDTMGIVQLPETVFYIGNDKDGSYPANGIIDDFKIYGYQYQDFSAGGPTLLSKMGSDNEISNPVVGQGGSSTASYVDYGYNNQHGYPARFTSTSEVVTFPTTNLNNASDTIDFYYRPVFDLSANEGLAKTLFRCWSDGDNYADIKVYNNRFQFRIRVNAVNSRIRTKPIGNGYENGGEMYYHIVCTWGLQGMRMYINDEEPELHPDVQEGLAYTGSLMPNGMPTNFTIGNNAAGASNNCEGYIDELRVYGYQAVPQRPDYWVPAP